MLVQAVGGQVQGPAAPNASQLVPFSITSLPPDQQAALASLVCDIELLELSQN